MNKYYLYLVLILFNSNLFAQNVQVTERLANQMSSLNPLQYTRVLILMKDRVNIDQLDKDLYEMNATIEYRAQVVINTLRDKAKQTQTPVLNYLNSEKESGKIKQIISYWITNLIFIEATPDVINVLTKRNDIEIMDLDAELEMDIPFDEKPAPHNTESVETGLRAIRADSLWRIGITGAGRTVMNIDGGVNGTHPALSPRWWGNNGRQWYHSWFDPIAPISTSPFDCATGGTYHGTHTMGIMCGRNTATGDTVGVAPDAYWMAAGVTDCPGASYPSMNIAAYQWAMDPDTNSVTMDMPDVINCSWRDPSATDECTSSIYRTTLTAVEAAGIAVVFSAGNSGPSTSSVTPPKNINIDSVNVFCVGSVNGSTLVVSSFSSRGPSLCGGVGTLLIKPEVSAPGESVRSTGSGSTYFSISGTSMASPHVAGAIALLKQAAPGMTGRQLKAILLSTATDLGVAGEDNDYGKGLINVYAAYKQLGLFPLNAFNLQTPAPGATIVSFPNSSTPVTITWDTAATGAQYKWIFGPAANPRQLTLPSSTNSITITLGQLDVILANAGVAQGSSLVGQWDVWSYRISPVDSLKSSNGPRALTLTRGVPALSGFGLNSPPSGTTITTSAFNSSLINIIWRKSGEGVTYKWKFGNPTLSNVRLSVPSNNSGYDTSLTIVNNALDGILGGLGLNPGDSLVGQWSVWAYNASDSLKSADTYAITLKRQAKGNVIVLYDSTVAGCRVARDSVVNNLNSIAETYDLFNRKGQTTGTTSISFRGYKKVILLGEGTSVVSNVVKDSIKAYLNSGGTTTETKSKLIILAEDIGYQLDRTGSTYLDTTFFRTVLGCQYIADRPGTSGNRGLVGVTTNPNIADSTVGTFPDVLKKSSSAPAGQLYSLYRFRLFPDSLNGIGRIGTNYNISTMGVDVESLRPAFDSPSGSPVTRLLRGAMQFVDGMLTNVSPVNPGVIPQSFSLAQNYPNPFNPTTKINFSIPKQGLVTLKIYDVLGKEVMTLVNETKAVGNYEVEFNGSNLASGAYFYRIESGEFTNIKRMILLK